MRHFAVPPARVSLIAAAAVILGATLAAPPPAEAAYKRCRPIINVFDGTQLAGSDLYRIRAQRVSCTTARRVVRRGTRRAVAGTPDRHGHVVARYRRWIVVGDLIGDPDHYEALGRWPARITWLFGDVR